MLKLVLNIKSLFTFQFSSAIVIGSKRKTNHSYCVLLMLYFFLSLFLEAWRYPKMQNLAEVKKPKYIRYSTLISIFNGLLKWHDSRWFFFSNWLIGLFWKWTGIFSKWVDLFILKSNETWIKSWQFKLSIMYATCVKQYITITEIMWI